MTKERVETPGCLSYPIRSASPALLGEPGRDVPETMALRLDVQRGVDALAPDLQGIRRSLVDGRHVKHVMAEAGLSRAVLTEKLETIRAAFEEAGLQDYLVPQKDAFLPNPVST